MSSGILLDTTIVIQHLRLDQAVSDQLLSAESLYLPIIVLGELLHGAYRIPFPERQLEKIAIFMRAVTVLGITTATADQFGQISAELSTSGQPIPTNDVWIAAVAREHQLPLATQDAHFERVSGLKLLSW